MQPKECVTLAEWRQRVLKLNQWQLAELARCSQTWIWKVENGHLPKPGSETYTRLVRAYGLIGQEEQFTRMVQNGARVKALKKHVSTDFPLALFANPSESGRVISFDIVRNLGASKPGKAVNE